MLQCSPVLAFFFMAVRHVGLSCLRKDQTLILCIGRQSLSHWTARDIPPPSLYCSNLISRYKEVFLPCQWLEVALLCTFSFHSFFSAFLLLTLVNFILHSCCLYLCLLSSLTQSKEELKDLLMRVKEESEKAGLKPNIQKTKIMASGPITSNGK